MSANGTAIVVEVRLREGNTRLTRHDRPKRRDWVKREQVGEEAGCGRVVMLTEDLELTCVDTEKVGYSGLN
jgi:hypothetical protein